MATKMKIAMSLLSGVSYGGMTYCVNFIPALARVDKVNEYHIFVQKGHPLLRLVHQDNFIFHECAVAAQSALMRFLWEQFMLPHELKKKKIDIIFTAKNANILFAPCKTITAIQNMEPLCYMWYKNYWKLNIFSWLRRQMTRISIKKADRIIVVSQSNKKHLERFFPEVSEKIEVTRNGNPVSQEAVKSDAHEVKEPFLLTASKFVAYANQLSLIEGYALLCQRKKDVPPLWFAGGVLDSVYFKKIMTLVKEKGLTEKVKILGFVPHERLIELYSRAFAFVFPSTLETCPMTLIEAMACRAPIATSNMGPMPEVCEDAAVYFEPFNKDDIADKMDLLLSDKNLRECLRRRSKERCRVFNWDEIAADMVKIFERTYLEEFLPAEEKIKIAISMLSGVSYGGVTYFKHLLPALAKIDKINEYHIFIQKDNPLVEINQENFFFHECAMNPNLVFIRFLWEQLVLPRELRKRKIDIIFTAKNVNVLLAPCKKIISLRNMEPLCYKNYKNYWKLNVFSWLRERFTRISIEKADRIIAVSKSTQNYLKDFFPRVSSKVDVIYHGNSIDNSTLNTNRGSEKSQFLLSASKFVSYANQFNIIEGYAMLYEEKRDLPPLWLAGGIHDPMYFKKVKRLIKKRGLEEKIKILGLVSHERLVELYSRALGFVFPSTLEACPQTLIEAMACGVPVATSNVDPMPEICKDGAIYFDPYDKGDIAEKIDMLLTDYDLRESLKEKSLLRCQFFDWNKTAADIVEVFEKV